jgi:hypothetical protein
MMLGIESLGHVCPSCSETMLHREELASRSPPT